MALDSSKLTAILTDILGRGASDLHFQTGKQPYIRVMGKFITLEEPELTQEDMIRLGTQLTGDKDFVRKSHSTAEITGAFSFRDQGRFRFNIFRHQGKLGAVLRSIPVAAPKVETLGFSPIFHSLLNKREGIIIFSGVASSGKTTTIASVIDKLNDTFNAHVITLEDPIEYIHTPRACRFTQRTIGRDSESFAEALQFIPRQDPDVVYISDVRDYETIKYCVSIAEAGHLVLVCANAPNVRKTISQLLSLAPKDERETFRVRFAENLLGVVAQQFVPGQDQNKKVVAQEILHLDEKSRACIFDESRIHMLEKIIEDGASTGTAQSFSHCLEHLQSQNTISENTARIFVGENRSELGKGVQAMSLDVGVTNAPPPPSNGQAVPGLTAENAEVTNPTNPSISTLIELDSATKKIITNPMPGAEGTATVNAPAMPSMPQQPQAAAAPAPAASTPAPGAPAMPSMPAMPQSGSSSSNPTNSTLPPGTNTAAPVAGLNGVAASAPMPLSEPSQPTIAIQSTLATGEVSQDAIQTQPNIGVTTEPKTPSTGETITKITPAQAAQAQAVAAQTITPEPVKPAAASPNQGEAAAFLSSLVNTATPEPVPAENTTGTGVNLAELTSEQPISSEADMVTEIQSNATPTSEAQNFQNDGGFNIDLPGGDNAAVVVEGNGVPAAEIPVDGAAPTTASTEKMKKAG